MEIFSNWVFWVVLASIVFVLALIGYLTESMKKPKKEENAEKEEPMKEEPTVLNSNEQPTEPVTNDWMTMPPVSNSLDEVKVESMNETASDTSSSADVLENETVNDTTPSVDESATTPAAEVTPLVDNTLNDQKDVPTVEENAEVLTTNVNVPNTSEEAKPTESTDEKNNDIWNL